MMEQLFRNTELESRIPLNMNVLSHGKVPKVMGLRQVLREWLDHRKDVLVRRSRFRLAEIARRLEILEGYLVAYLNLDEVIRIIREDDEPKQVMMATFKLTDNQAEAILNMRLRSLRKLEEMEIRGEHAKLVKEQKGLNALLKSEDEQWAKISEEIKAVKEKFSKKTVLGRRRTDFSEAPEIDVDLEQSMIDKEPVTVVCSEKGWIRTMRGHLEDFSGLTYKDGDTARFTFHAMTDRQGDAVLVVRKILHARRGEASRRTRPWRTCAPHVRSRCRRPDRVALRPSARNEAPARLHRGRRLHRDGRGMPRHHAQGQTGAERQGARRGRALRQRAGRCHSHRHHRREPQDGHLQAAPTFPKWRAARACACRSSRTAA